jgi:FG-GAP-like repeat
MKVSGKIFLLILILSGFSALRCGAAVYHSDGSAANVQALHNYFAQNGDTIMLPAGTFTWTTAVRLSKAITLQGKGIGRTIIRDAFQTRAVLGWHLEETANGAARLTGIEFQDGGRTQTATSPGGVITIIGSNTNGTTFRWDHCKMIGLNGAMTLNTVIGVVDHNVIQSSYGGGFCIWGSYWNNDPAGYGDRSWSAPTNFGSSQFLFLEDNTYACTAAALRPMTDAYAGARFVVRHNSLYNANIANHGTDSSGRLRSGRAMEIYNNTFIGRNLGNIVGGCRGGIVLFYNNTVSGFWSNPLYMLIPFRSFANLSRFRGGADGTNPWDVNRLGGPFFTGTAQGPSVGLTVRVAGANWSTNQWAGYSVKRTTNLAGATGVTFGFITSNTANTFTYMDSGGFQGNLKFASGDSLQLWKVDQALDQPGRAGGSLVTGNSPTLPAGWNDQVTEPCYSWNNVRVDGAGAPAPVNFAHTPLVRQGEHFFNKTAMPGYTPYIYPHPLVTGAPRAVIADFNGDGSPDCVLQNASTHQTAIWYLNNNVFAGGAYGPTLSGDWGLAAAADFNGDTHADYALVNAATNPTGIWYLSGPAFIGGAYGPTLPRGWELVAATDFNGDGNPDYVLYKASIHQTAIWYLNNNVFAGGAYGPTLPPSWSLVAVADFNRDGHPDYALFNPSTGQTAIWYLSGPTFIGGAYGPTLPGGWALVAAADFNGDGSPDYVLYKASIHQTAIWYLNNNVFAGGAYGPTLPPSWSLVPQ